MRCCLPVPRLRPLPAHPRQAPARQHRTEASRPSPSPPHPTNPTPTSGGSSTSPSQATFTVVGLPPGLASSPSTRRRRRWLWRFSLRWQLFLVPSNSDRSWKRPPASGCMQGPRRGGGQGEQSTREEGSQEGTAAVAGKATAPICRAWHCAATQGAPVVQRSKQRQLTLLAEALAAAIEDHAGQRGVVLADAVAPVVVFTIHQLLTTTRNLQEAGPGLGWSGRDTPPQSDSPCTHVPDTPSDPPCTRAGRQAWRVGRGEQQGLCRPAQDGPAASRPPYSCRQASPPGRARWCASGGRACAWHAV